MKNPSNGTAIMKNTTTPKLAETKQQTATHKNNPHSPLDTIILGAPGSGKGTQADRICAAYDIVHIATGDIFRENLKNETELGLLAKQYMNRGDLVPDEVTINMVRDRLARPDVKHGFILDGFPRTIPQVEALNAIMHEMRRQLSGVLYIKVADEEIVKRLSGRLVCRECGLTFHKEFNPFKSCPYHKCNGEHLYQRDDDKPEVVRARLQTYHKQTAPLVQYYNDAGLLVEIDGQGALDEVTERVMAVLDGWRQKRS